MRSIALKLGLAFGVLLALTCAIGIAATLRLGSIEGTTEALGDDAVPSGQAISDITAETGSYRRNQLIYLLSEPGEERRGLVADLDSGAAAVADDLRTYRAELVTDGRDGADLRQFAAAWESYLRTSRPSRSAADRGDREAAFRVLDVGAANRDWDAVKGLLTRWQETVSAQGATQVAAAHGVVRGTRWLIIGLLVASLLAGAALATVLSRRLVRDLRQLVRAARGIAGGDVDQAIDVRSRDELGQASEAFGEMVRYLQETADVADRIADGDLSTDVTPRSEADRLGVALQGMRGRLHGALQRVAGSAATLASTSTQIATSSGEVGRAATEIAEAVQTIAEGAEHQVTSVEDARAVAVEMTDSVQATTRTAQEAAAAAESARETARTGVRAADELGEVIGAVRASSREVAGAVTDLGAKSEQIGGIVTTIAGIAEQTNLLALNAAIEAARAGDHGRGFAVVADEVRKLAEESQAASGSIAGLLGEIQVQTRGAVALAEDGARRSEESARVAGEARSAFGEIERSADDVSSRVATISDAATTLAGGADRLRHAVDVVADMAERSSASTEQVSASTQQTSASTQEVAASADDLSRTASELDELVRRFRLEPVPA